MYNRCVTVVSDPMLSFDEMKVAAKQWQSVTFDKIWLCLATTVELKMILLE